MNTFERRLKRIGIRVEIVVNYPWAYLWKINGKRVTETFYANHGFTIGFMPVQKGKPFQFLDLKKIFELIRKSRPLGVVMYFMFHVYKCNIFF